MGTYRRGRAAAAVRSMTEGEAMWFAGLFDGEGSVTLTARRRCGGGTVRLAVYNTSLLLLERVVAVTGVGKVVKRRGKAKPYHLDAWTWTCYGATALEILRQIVATE